jgi:hypothetical protein
MCVHHQITGFVLVLNDVYVRIVAICFSSLLGEEIIFLFIVFCSSQASLAGTSDCGGILDLP